MSPVTLAAPSVGTYSESFHAVVKCHEGIYSAVAALHLHAAASLESSGWLVFNVPYTSLKATHFQVIPPQSVFSFETSKVSERFFEDCFFFFIGNILFHLLQQTGVSLVSVGALNLPWVLLILHCCSCKRGARNVSRRAVNDTPRAVSHSQRSHGTCRKPKPLYFNCCVTHAPACL